MSNLSNTSLPAVITNFEAARSPVSEIAKALAAKAAEKRAGERKQGGIKDLAVGRSDTFRLSPYDLVIEEGFNSRDLSDPANLEHIDNLAKSIAVNGVIEPLTVFWKNGAPTVTNGHCRLLGTFRAIEVYGAEVVSVPVKTENKGANETDRLFTQIISNSGKTLTALETASLYKRLLGLGLSIPAIAERAAVSVSRVNQLLELGAAPEAVKQLVTAGRVSPTTAWEVTRSAGSDEEAVETLTKAVEAAAEAGKTKATKRHFTEATTKVSFRKAITAAFEKVKVDDSAEEVKVTFSVEDWETIRALLKL